MSTSRKAGCSRDHQLNQTDRDQNSSVKKNPISAALLAAGLFLLALTFTGCWTPPNANVQPPGKPGLVQGDIPVDVIQYPVTVKAIDLSRRTITLAHADDSQKVFNVLPSVDNLEAVKVGDVIRATVKAHLSVYILDHGRLPNADGTSRPKTINFNARVLSVDPSYRLLTVQFTNGRTLTIKTALNVQLTRMAPGMDVVMRSNDVTRIQISNR